MAFELVLESVVCGNTMCVSTCQVEFVLTELSCYLTTTRVDGIEIGCDYYFSL